MIYIIFLINLTALVLTIIRRGLPQPFPWASSVLLAIVLLLGGLFTDIARGVAFVTLLSVVIISGHATRYLRHVPQVFFALSILLTVFILADAFRLIPSPDVTMTAGETFSFIRRPYLFEHPNLKACWLLLLSLSPVTLIGIIVTQSRGALMGYIAALVRFIPKRFYIHAATSGLVIIGVTALLRPGTFFARLDFWHDGLNLFLSSPLFGHGTGSYLALAGNGMITAHNAILTIAAENGLIGLIALGAWLISTGALVVRSTNPMRFGLLAFSVQQMVDDQWLAPVTAILLGVAIGVCVFQSEKNE